MKNKTVMFLLFAIAIVLTNCKKEDENNLKGLTFTLLEEPGYHSSIRLSDINIVNYKEILGYDSTQFTFLLDDKAKERILEYKTSSFAVAVDGVIVYFASFIPGYISQSCYECIRIEPYSLNNKYRVELGYPGGIEFAYEDPRNDEKILNILERDGKLIGLEQ
jgi:hypothetical protein